METEKPWKLHIGSHRKTLMSRDSSVDGYDSLEECKRAFKRAEESWAKMGYFVWYAYAIGPDEKKVYLHAGTPYS
jgi:hypothetical protein